MNPTATLSAMRLLHDEPWPVPLPGTIDDVARLECARVFGVEYARIIEADGGELFVTRYGWPLVEHCRPAAWYHGHRYAEVGVKLTGGTGSVYRVPTVGRRGREVALVVKFSRFAQDVPLLITDDASRHITRDAVANARFNSPFEEFGILNELRVGRFGPAHLRVRTKRPLAIYCPPHQESMWRLGRTDSRFDSYRRRQQYDQEKAADMERADLHGDRVYVMIFAFVKGENAESLYERGVLSDDELHKLSDRISDEVYEKGFLVLDHKPKHIILRLGKDGRPIRRDGKCAYTIVDFELMKRTEEYLAARRGD